jgi:hypothetical protein
LEFLNKLPGGDLHTKAFYAELTDEQRATIERLIAKRYENDAILDGIIGEYNNLPSEDATANDLSAYGRSFMRVSEVSDGDGSKVEFTHIPLSDVVAPDPEEFSDADWNRKPSPSPEEKAYLDRLAEPFCRAIRGSEKGYFIPGEITVVGDFHASGGTGGSRRDHSEPPYRDLSATKVSILNAMVRAEVMERAKAALIVECADVDSPAADEVLDAIIRGMIPGVKFEV